MSTTKDFYPRVDFEQDTYEAGIDSRDGVVSNAAVRRILQNYANFVKDLYSEYPPMNVGGKYAFFENTVYAVASIEGIPYQDAVAWCRVTLVEQFGVSKRDM